MSRERLLAIVNLMTEITQTISELALQKHIVQKRSTQYLNRLINSASDCIISTNADNTISMINNAGARMFGHEPEALIGQNILNLFADETSKRLYLQYVGSRLSHSWRTELKALSSHGDSFPVQVSLSAINGMGEASEGYVGVIRDISEEKRIERMKEDLIGMLTHDMRNPILSIQKAVQLLLGETVGPLNRRQIQILSMALGTTYNIYGMVSDLLDIYRNESGTLTLYKSQLTVDDVLSESFKQVQFFAQEKRIFICIENLVHQNMYIFGDLSRLTRVFVNLLDNAIKYSPEGSTVRIATIAFDPGKSQEVAHALIPKAQKALLNDSYVMITISDKGIGIAKEYHEKIFDKFFTIKSRKHTGRKSVGLGLAFCRQIVEAHGGLIWVDSPLDTGQNSSPQGCRFYVVLPAQRT